jgi:hypothetical protein
MIGADVEIFVGTVTGRCLNELTIGINADFCEF